MGSASRNRGIGRDLLKFIAAEAVRRDCCKLEWSSQKSNSRGVAFYEREGAVIREENWFAKLDESAIDRLLSHLKAGRNNAEMRAVALFGQIMLPS